jgi:hypothetical protein
LILLAALQTTLGCQDTGEQTKSTHDGPAASTGFENELMEADRRFAAEVAAAAPTDRGKVWAGWFSPTGRQIVPGNVVQGSRSITALMGPAFAAPGYSLTWEPDLASSGAAGDMGWTSGRYESRRAGPEGDILEHGRYLTIWKRGPDGRWKVAVDTGVPDSRD